MTVVLGSDSAHRASGPPPGRRPINGYIEKNRIPDELIHPLVRDLLRTLYLDQDVSVLLGKILVGRGFDVLTTRDAGNLGAEDDEQLAFAVGQGRPILTHNRDDFEQLHREYLEQARHHYGIFVATRRPVYQIARRVQALLNTLIADELEKQILHV